MLMRFFYPTPDRQCLRGAAPSRHLYGEHPTSQGGGASLGGFRRNQKRDTLIDIDLGIDSVLFHLL